MSHDDFDQKLEIARKTIQLLKSESGRPGEVRLKEDLLHYLEEEELSQARSQEPRVFVSFAGKSGPGYFTRFLKLLKQDGRFALEHAMTDQGKASVLGTIRSKMSSCNLFLAILTKEYDLGIADDENNRYAPGKWVMLELGMALSLDLRITLLIEKGMHKDFWLDPVNNWRHVEFPDGDHFDSKAKMAIGRLWSHYVELRELAGSGG